MNKIKIRQWMLEAGVTQVQIAKEAKISKTMVNLVLCGKRRHNLIPVLLRGHGCPKEYLETGPSEKGD